MTGRRALAALLALLLAAPAVAQMTEEEALERLEERVEDADPLATSLRELRLDLRAPSDFEHVYHVPGREDLLMRVDGGLYAVFSMSRYLDTGFGAIPLIPAGTIFFVGRPEPRDVDALAPPAPVSVTAHDELPSGAGAPRLGAPPLDLRTTSRVRSRLDLRVDDTDPPAPPPADAADRRRPARAAPDGPRPAAAIDRGGPAILADADYRSSRLHALMRRAAAAVAAREPYAARGPGPSSSSK